MENNKQIKSAKEPNVCFKTGFLVFLFLIIGILLFLTVQKIIVPKRFAYVKSYDAGKLAGYYTEQTDSIDVIICGTSHVSKGILPMELYEAYGIKAYNLGMSSQPIQVTYYVIAEALKTQNPKVVIFDVSRLLSNNYSHDALFAIDEMKIGKNKVALSRQYVDKMQSDISAVDLLIPFLQYHTRWKELTDEDFTYALRNTYYGKGGQIVSNVLSSDISLEQMNLVADELMQNTVEVRYKYIDGIYEEEKKENVLYKTEISNENLEWLKKIKELCTANNIQLLAVKVPSLYMPQYYSSAWTEEKYEAARTVCDAYGIPYYDLQYDSDVNIDWSHDSSDGGQHLNVNGAQKVSLNLGAYLKERYEFTEERDAQWDKDLQSYQKARNVAKLQAEQEFTSYLYSLADAFREKVIFISVAGDMAAGLTEDDIAALKTLGLQTDFSNAFQCAYAAVIDQGEVKYEELSNRALEYSGQMNSSGKKYTIYSSGDNTRPSSNITLEGAQVAIDHIGINIVVYDVERALVLDSVCFDTSLEEHTVVRRGAKTVEFLEAFEKYLVEKED